MRWENMTLSQKKKKLWKVFSQYIRKRDKMTCFTCQRKGEGAGIHAGHWIPDSVGGLALKFHEKNVHAQCYHCNINLGGWGERYTERMEQVYGKETINELRQLKNKITKDLDFEKLYEKYK